MPAVVEVQVSHNHNRTPAIIGPSKSLIETAKLVNEKMIAVKKVLIEK